MRRRREQHNLAAVEEAPRKRQKHTNPAENKVGTIAQMVLRNFMCHSYLEVNFEHNINFVIGRNGSGKSAILTALIVGLGAKANVTNRGTSLKCFVKAGTNSASVEITLSNSGPLSYKQNVFGESITIHRTISASGGSTYKVKAANGEIISRAYKDIATITTALNIQVDNPVCVLNQDTSRNFLSSKDPHMKYNLFTRATSIEILYNEYREWMNNRNKSIEEFEEKNRFMKELNVEIEALRKKIEEHKDIEEKKIDLLNLKRELLWSKVIDCERELDEHQGLVQNKKEEHAKLEEMLTNKNGLIEESQTKINEYKAQIQELKDSMSVQNIQKHDSMRALEEFQTELSKKQHELKLYQRDVVKKKEEKNAVQNEIDNFKAKASEFDKQRLENFQVAADLEQKIKKMQEMTDTFQNEIFQANGAVSKKEQNMRNILSELKDVDTKCNSTKETLLSLKSKKGNKYAVYGKEISRLNEVIEANKEKFSRLPKGPIGSYISLKNKKWIVAVEGFIGKGLLNTFLVNTTKDRDVLVKILNEQFPNSPKPTIITSKFIDQIFNVEDQLVKDTRGCVSIFNAISIADPVVMNCLIDQLRIESILLIPTADLAIELMSVEANVPRNCIQAVTMSGDQYYPVPKYKMYSSKYKQARYLQVNTKALINELSATLENLTKNKVEIRQKYELVKEEIDADRKQIREIETKVQKCKTGISVAKKKLLEINTSDSYEGQDLQLEAEIVNLDAQIQKSESKIEHLEEEIKSMKRDLVKLEEKLEKIKDSGKSLGERIEGIEQKLKEQFHKLEQLNANNQTQKRKIDESKNRLLSAQKQLEQIERSVELHVQQASHFGERPVEIRNVPEVAEKMKALQSLIARMETENVNVDQLMNNWLEKCEIYRKGNDVLDIIKKDLHQLQEAFERRKRLCKNTRDYFENLLKHCFMSFLEIRQFKGTLKINFDEKKLELVVIPQQNNLGVTNTTNLSGGERSFSTVAFLYSLWQCLDCPFFFLDEFDVFMDKLNRSKVIELLIHHAKTHPSIQFVFLTPQDVSFIDTDSVALHRLEDPKR